MYLQSPIRTEVLNTSTLKSNYLVFFSFSSTVIRCSFNSSTKSSVVRSGLPGSVSLFVGSKKERFFLFSVARRPLPLFAQKKKTKNKQNKD